MQFNIKNRDGPARIGYLQINKKNFVTPNILYVNTQRFASPRFADVLLTNKKINVKKTNLFVSRKNLETNVKFNGKKINLLEIVENAQSLIFQPKKFVENIVKLREKIGPQKIIYLPGLGNPTNFALFSYMGIDLFDSIYAINSARDNIMLFSDEKKNINEIEEIQCNCPSCINLKVKPKDMSFKEILNHNYFSIYKELKKVRNAIIQNNLRQLVEIRSITDPNLTSILRILDNNYYSFLEKQTSITSKQKILATSSESLYRPEIKRYQKRIINRYKKPNSAKILLLLPCSAKKPYSFSKSHKFFRDKILSSSNPFIFHEVIITSPIGIVPRDLELVYPASNYDIPVTGIWSEDEKIMIRNQLKDYFKKNKYEKIISHLPNEINNFIEDILDKPQFTCINNPSSDESLEKLSKTLEKNIKNFNKIQYQEKSFENVGNLASYQFGKKTADILLKNTKIKGKYPYQKIIQNNTQLGMITKERGLISLTLNGAEKIKNTNVYQVEIHGDFKLKGSVFAPGVKKASEEIRIGDEVLVIQKNKLIAVGVAAMNGEEMEYLNHGEAVKVRHKI